MTETERAENKREFALLFEHSELQQKALANLLGVSTMTVNRWLTERGDGVDPPYYAINFLRAYLMLKPAQRDRLPMKGAAGHSPG